MNSSAAEVKAVRGQRVVVTEDSLTVDLDDGRSIILPLAWFPRLVHARHEERENWQITGAGEGIHWPDLDEDISVEHLILGWGSRESQASFQRWLGARAKLKGESSSGPGPLA